LLNKVGRSRSVRAATAITKLVHRRREAPVWQYPDRLREYVDRQVERSLKATVVRPGPTPALQVPTAAGRSDLIRAGMASISTRADGMLRVIDDLYDQVDEIYVYLNDYTELPSGLVRD